MNALDKNASEVERVENAKRSVSAPSELLAAADRRMAERMITNFSEYVRALIREDLNGDVLHPIPVPERNGHDREE